MLCIQNMGVSDGTEACGSGRRVWEVEVEMKLWPDWGAEQCIQGRCRETWRHLSRRDRVK